MDTGETGIDLAEQGLAILGEGQAAAMADEEQDPEIPFKALDVAGDGALRQGQVFSCAAKTQPARDSGKGIKGNERGHGTGRLQIGIGRCLTEFRRRPGPILETLVDIVHHPFRICSIIAMAAAGLRSL
jgi:hypothetical protein